MVLNVTQDAPAVPLSDSSLHTQTVSGTVNWTAVATSEASIAGMWSFVRSSLRSGTCRLRAIFESVSRVKFQSREKRVRYVHFEV